MLNFLKKMRGNSLIPILREWSTVARRQKLGPTFEASMNISETMTMYQKDIIIKQGRIEYLLERIIVQTNIIKKLNQSVIEQEEKYLSPSRYTKKILYILGLLGIG